MRSGTKCKIIDYTEGCIPKQLLFFAIPFMASNAMQVLYSLVDMLIVGRFVGSYGLSAVSVSSQILTFATMLCVGLSTGGQVYIAQLIGANKRELISNTVGTMFSTLAFMGIIISAVIVFCREMILKLINTPSEAYAMASQYLLVCGAGMIFSFGYNMAAAIFRGMGDSRHPFLFIVLASAVNLLLDLGFTGALRLGVLGAALATVAGQGVSCICAILFLYRKREAFYLEFGVDNFRIRWKILAPLTRLSIPFAISSCSVNISMLFVNSMVNTVGVYASAVFGVGCKLDDIVNKVAQGIMLALSPIVEQNMAAGKTERIRKGVYWSWF